VDHSTKRPAWLPEFRKRCDTYYEDGEAKGINFSLSVAVELARRMLATARDSRERGTVLNLLGSALWTLGERESGTARLEEAVATYRAALEEFRRHQMPLDWAMTQANLGNALTSLGERESGTAGLEEAIAAYLAALEERGRDQVPLDWAMTQNNLGAALQLLGQRESGTARLEEAIAAHRNALEENRRDRVPLDWATTQMNLGNALLCLGERESGTVRLEEAVAAWDECLKITEFFWPAEWISQARARQDETRAQIKRRSAK
jgi:tetratricopeptide (TPR) repeat protein